MIQLDKYTTKARLYPSFLVLLPAFILGLFYVTDIEKYYHYITVIFSYSLFSFLISQLGRDKGKLKEADLFVYFGGKPTTQILRHDNDYLDRVTKERYHRLLSNLITGLRMPTSVQEANDSKYADEVYESCAKYLISNTRDTKKFNLLFKENINYGFRRNLWGMKTWALCFLLLCFILHLFMVSNYFTNFYKIDIKDILPFVIIFIIALFWIFIVTRNWVKIPAYAYAERLYESLNVLSN